MIRSIDHSTRRQPNQTASPASIREQRRAKPTSRRPPPPTKTHCRRAHRRRAKEAAPPWDRQPSIPPLARRAFRAAPFSSSVLVCVCVPLSPFSSSRLSRLQGSVAGLAVGDAHEPTHDGQPTATQPRSLVAEPPGAAAGIWSNRASSQAAAAAAQAARADQGGIKPKRWRVCLTEISG